MESHEEWLRPILVLQLILMITALVSCIREAVFWKIVASDDLFNNAITKLVEYLAFDYYVFNF